MHLYMTTDEQKAILITKGVETILPSQDFLEKELNSGKKLSIYCGFDPTAPTLHIGHTIQLRKLRQFQELGHSIIFLIGDFTARIGDPTDKGAARKQLTEKEIKTNLRLYKRQAGKFIRFSGRNAARVRFNSKWLGKMKFADVLGLASQMTVDQMLKRDMFAKRVEEEKPIYIHEFMYPLMQGYDSVAMNVDGEVGGNDQLFNMMAGRTLLRQLKQKEKFVITTKLLEDSSGKKMGKSEGNMVSLLDNPVDMYGKIMSWSDGLIVPGFELCTNYTPSEVTLIAEKLKIDNPRDSKMLLAFEIVRECHSEKDAHLAQQAFIDTFQKSEIPKNLEEISSSGKSIEELFLDKNLVLSKGELRRLVEAGAITNLDTNQRLKVEDTKSLASSGVYKIGKNRFIKIV